MSDTRFDLQRAEMVAQSVAGRGVRSLRLLEALRRVPREAFVPAALHGQVRAGMAAQVVPELPGAQPVAARVAVVDPVMDAASGTFGVRLALPNPDNVLPAGVRCAVRFAPESR